MGKHDFLTPKAIANRIKSKGLQKLRWYCQLCNKQCRDENGFKCHQTSESHRRQMEVFGMNPKRIIEGYSEMFESDFMTHLRRGYPHARVLAKNVYNEFISARDHIHMNSTKWLTLSDFVKYLGREGKCKVEETEKGWYITLIHKEPEELLAEGRKVKRTVAEKEEEERHQASLRAQVRRARELAQASGAQEEEEVEGGREEGPSALDLETKEEVVVLNLKPTAAAAAAAAGAAGAGAAGERDHTAGPSLKRVSAFDDEDDEGPSTSKAGPRKRSKLEELMERELRAKEEKAKEERGRAPRPPPVPVPPKGRVDHWLQPGIVVKVMSQALKEHGYYKQKGVVDRVIDKYVGEISMLTGGDVIRVDQAELETVIPSPGGQVLVVNGSYRGAQAKLLDINTAKFQAHLRITTGPSKGVECWADYEDFSKKY